MSEMQVNNLSQSGLKSILNKIAEAKTEKKEDTQNAKNTPTNENEQIETVFEGLGTETSILPRKPLPGPKPPEGPGGPRPTPPEGEMKEKINEAIKEMFDKILDWIKGNETKTTEKE